MKLNDKEMIKINEQRNAMIKNNDLGNNQNKTLCILKDGEEGCKR